MKIDEVVNLELMDRVGIIEMPTEENENNPMISKIGTWQTCCG